MDGWLKQIGPILDEAADRYRESRRARDEARAKVDVAQRKVLALTVDLYHEMTGRDLRQDLSKSDRRAGPPREGAE
jgi:hypothetical protein